MEGDDVDLFPLRPRATIGSTPDGLDADHRDHSSGDIPRPDLTVTDPPAPVGILWSPDGASYREVDAGRTVPFGFCQL